MLWLQVIELKCMLTSVSMSCTAIGLPFKLEAELLPITSITQNRNYNIWYGMSFCTVKNHFYLRSCHSICFPYYSFAVQIYKSLF